MNCDFFLKDIFSDLAPRRFSYSSETRPEVENKAGRTEPSGIICSEAMPAVHRLPSLESQRVRRGRRRTIDVIERLVTYHVISHASILARSVKFPCTATSTPARSLSSSTITIASSDKAHNQRTHLQDGHQNFPEKSQ